MKKLTIIALSVSLIFLSGCVNQTTHKPIEPKTKAYYDSFREKCDTDGCCLSSVKNAEKENSLIFESNNGGMNIENECPDGYQLDMNKCITSYIWCIKK